MPTERPPFVGNLVPTFIDRVVSRTERGGSLTGVLSVFYTGADTFSFK
jgi:hypothetical protein